MIETKFKHTDIGLVPEEWSLFSVGEDVTVHARIGWQGLTTNEYMSHGIYKLVTSTDIENGAVNWNTCHYVSEWRYKQDEKIILSDGDTLLSKDGTIGKVAFVKDIPSPSTLNSGVYVLRPKDESSLTKSYLALCFKSVYFKDFMERLSAGSTINHLYQKDIVGFTFPVPPVDEQHRIASVLMKVDALISNLDKLIQKKQAIKKGAMQELLTGKKRLPGFKGEWKVIRLGDVADIKTGSSNVQDADPSGSYPFFIRSEHVEKSNKYIFDCEAILIPGEGRIGEIFHYINGKFDCHQRVYTVSNFRWVNAVFVLFYMKYKFKEHALSQTAKATVDSLRLPTIKSFEMHIPTDISEQRAIAHVLSTMDSDISALEKKRDKYRQIKQGMMRDLLTGRIRLVENDHMERKCYSIGLQNQSFDGAVAAEPSPQ